MRYQVVPMEMSRFQRLLKGQLKLTLENDRKFKEGDCVIFQETHAGKVSYFTGRAIAHIITSIQTKPTGHMMLLNGHCLLNLRILTEAEEEMYHPVIDRLATFKLRGA
ncbi:DUF3850 domain-containing protein [Cytobacillus sp. FJAT-54145]|uniref:DUF3850 domain-containing protein n=1 Tax=Cytobacillus spartinae TaxID=3299023 RepID=A0ABW6KDZ3_9BACI